MDIVIQDINKDSNNNNNDNTAVDIIKTDDDYVQVDKDDDKDNNNSNQSDDTSTSNSEIIYSNDNIQESVIINSNPKLDSDTDINNSDILNKQLDQIKTTSSIDKEHNSTKQVKNNNKTVAVEQHNFTVNVSHDDWIDISVYWLIKLLTLYKLYHDNVKLFSTTKQVSNQQQTPSRVQRLYKPLTIISLLCLLLTTITGLYTITYNIGQTTGLVSKPNYDIVINGLKADNMVWKK